MKRKVLISSDGPTAHYYIRLGLARAFNAYGYEVNLWDCKNVPATDVFDKFKPDIFLGQSYNLNKTLVSLIKESPWLKVVLRGADWGSITKEVSSKYPILVATEQEKRLVEEIRGQVYFVHSHYHPNHMEFTHGFWKNIGVKVESVMNAADVFDYTNGKFDESLSSHVCFVGGYWPYKSKTLDPYIMALCKDFKYNVKIFGNQPWPCPQYCGFLPNEKVKDALFSSIICPNVSEKHSQEYGYDIVERPFKLLANKCFVISDYVLGLDDILYDGIVFANDPEHFHELVDYYISNPEARNKYIDAGHKRVIEKHTYLDRAKFILEKLGEYAEFDMVKQNVLSKLKI